MSIDRSAHGMERTTPTTTEKKGFEPEKSEWVNFDFVNILAIEDPMFVAPKNSVLAHL